MQYTPHYNLNLPEGTDIVNPLIQDNPNYSAIDTALYNNKLRVIGTATHTKTGTNHSIVLADSDIPAFKFVATGDYATGDTFTVDGVTVTARIADGSSIPSGAFKINSTVLAILDGTILNLINVIGLNAGAVTTELSNLSSKFSTITRYETVVKQPGTIINFEVVNGMCIGSARLMKSEDTWDFTDDGMLMPTPSEITVSSNGYGIGMTLNGSVICVTTNGRLQIRDFNAGATYNEFVSFAYPVAP